MIQLRGSSGSRSAGFTIVEFMIATSVFGVVILGVSSAILHLTRSYQHSLYTSQTQAAASNLVDTVAQAVKFSNSSVIETGNPSEGTGSYCVGTRQFLYVIGKQIDGSTPASSTRNAVMTRLTPSTGCTADSITGTTPPSGEPKELLGKNMRLSKLTVKQDSGTPAIWNITARVVYGDDDLLCSPTLVDSCSNTETLQGADLLKDDLTCRPQSGSEFCAVSELSTTVYRRL